MNNPVVLVLVILLILLLFGLFPGTGINHSFGYWPSGGVGLVLLILIVLLVVR